MTDFRSRLARRPGAAQQYPDVFLDALADRVRALAATRDVTLVAIDGWGCGGKTSLAEGLLDRLEPGATYLGVDEFFHAFPFPALDPFPTTHLRWDELRQAIGNLRGCGQTTIRPYDWDTQCLGPTEEIGGPVVIVEGLFSLHRELASDFDFAIWVQSRLSTRADRVAARDGAHMIPFWDDDWGPRERGFFEVERPWDRADLIVAGADIALAEVGTRLRTL